VAAELVRLAPAAPAIADVTAEMTAAERAGLYASTKHLFVTTRIVVVDLLTRRIPPRQVAGLLVMNAHRSTDQSGEGFAVRCCVSFSSSLCQHPAQSFDSCQCRQDHQTSQVVNVAPSLAVNVRVYAKLTSIGRRSGCCAARTRRRLCVASPTSRASRAGA
jgi:hypothetical protein